MKSRAVKRREAAERQALRDKRTPQEQWGELDRRFANATKERDRLEAAGANQ